MINVSYCFLEFRVLLNYLSTLISWLIEDQAIICGKSESENNVTATLPLYFAGLSWYPERSYSSSTSNANNLNNFRTSIWRTTPDPGIQNRFSVLRTEPCVNEVFSVLTCIHRRFDSHHHSGSKTMRVGSSLSQLGWVQYPTCLRSSRKTANFLRNPGVRRIPSYEQSGPSGVRLTPHTPSWDVAPPVVVILDVLSFENLIQREGN